MDSTIETTKKKKDKPLVWLIIILIIAVGGAFAWWWNYRKYISTDDANLDTYRVDVSARVTAPIQKFFVIEGDTVKIGQMLAALDTAGILATSADRVYCSVSSPVNGVIAKVWMTPGDVIQPGQTLFTINEGNNIWVSVYLSETKFRYIYLGQEAHFTLDAYKGVTFHGKIFYIGSNTASQFSLIPPTNASGNYTKISQRIPIKISIDGMEGKEKDTKGVKLISGMSASVKIIKKK